MTADNNEECIGLGASLDSFKESEEISRIINNLPETVFDDNKHELAVERFKYVLDWYQEQPHLLDPHLETILSLLIVNIRKETEPKILHATTQLMSHLFKVRGSKIVVKYLPHEVEDLERVVELLQEQDSSDTSSWETKYILLLWLSIIVLIPFDMARFDGGDKAPLVERILSCCKRYLVTRDKCREAAARLVSSFLTRPDTRDTLLPSFIDWCLQRISDNNSSEPELTGAVMAVCSILKHSKREDVIKYAPTILSHYQQAKLSDHANTIIRKFGLKMVQRLGLVFLKARVASWRYQRGNRSLALNLNASAAGDSEDLTNKTTEDDEEYDVPDEIEEVIEELLTGLRDKDTIVRWSAAKGVGRVTGRLPSDLADEVVASLIELFTVQEMDCGWHGGCLALAELGRRGLLLPGRLGEVVPHILTALVYDERKGSFSVGSHIRDAACYVCWSFARAYEPLVLRPHVASIANGLLIVACFDREVNCRRAASAAFQENVGRQGTFPHGIDILTVADYFSVGSRNNSYLDISVFIAGYQEYSRSLIQHLVDKKIGHWDASVRELTAKALHNLTGCDAEHVRDVVLPQLLDSALGRDLHLCHGSTLAAGEIVEALSKEAGKHGVALNQFLQDTTVSKIESLVQNMIEKHKLRGLGGEIMRQAVSSFIKNISRSGLELQNRAVVGVWLEVLEENVACVEVSVQQAAIDAFPAFFDQFWLINGVLDEERRNKTLNNFLEKLNTNNENVRKGFSSVLGVLPGSFVRGREEDVLHALIRCSKVSDATEKWAEARRESVKGVGTLVCTCLPWLSADIIPHVYDCFLLSLEDYTLDRRGDIGAWVREAGMVGVEAVTLALLEAGGHKIQPSLIGQIMPYLVQQANEKIARTRGQAGKVFYSLLWASSAGSGQSLEGVPRAEELRGIFPQNLDITWTVESDTFPRFIRLLTMPEYVERLILGNCAYLPQKLKVFFNHK